MFLKPIMLAGLGAALLPVVLHLLSKARYRTVDWGGMMFLDAGVLRPAQSTRLKQAVLLLMRVGIIACLALALARPVLRSGASAAGDETRVHAVILLDRSASMGFEEHGRPRMAAAKQAVVNVLSNLHRGDEVSLILTGDVIDPGEAQPTTDLQSIATRVGALSPSFGRANIASALERVRDLLAREPNVAHELYLVCDRQAVSWENVNDKFADAWRKTREEIAAPLRFFVIPVGGEDADNLAIESIRIPGPPIVVGAAAQVEVRLRNFGPIPRSDVPLTILINGRTVAETTANVPPDTVGAASAAVRFSASGSQVLSARLRGSGLRADDRIDTAINVLEPARVLVISGDPPAAGVRTSADYLRLALAPHGAAGAPGVDPAVVRSIGVDDWWGISLERDDVLILNNVGVLNEEQISQLEQFLYRGGALIYAPGSLTDVDACNLDLYRDGEGFLPASLKAVSDQPTMVGQIDKTHPIFHFMNEGAGEALDVPISRALEIEDRGADARVLASLADGRPFIVERAYGRGRVLMFTSTLGGQWNALPISPLYLPVLQSAVRYLAGGNLPDRNLKPGEPIELSFDHPPVENAGTLTLPGGQQRRVLVIQAGQRWTLRFGDTGQPGRYILSFPDQRVANYVVSAPRNESDIAPLSADRWTWLERTLEFRRIDSEKQELARAVAAARTGRELHLPLIALVMMLALGEMFLARWWSDSR